MRDLSVIIPARQEMFLNKTVENILENIEADTEIIVICDGNWPMEPLQDHPRVTVVHHTEPIGQRAATNEGARISQAKYVMKADAHCAFGKGFDRILIEDCQPNWVMIPKMWNLHAFDWQCNSCGNRTYQSDLPIQCEKCQHNDFEMVVVWQPRGNKVTYSWRFDSEMNFQYWRKHVKRKECKGDLIETMSFIGACMFMERDQYWKLEGCDEAHGSWGNYGSEWACKAWLSGGKLITSKKTWFAHFFRTGNMRKYHGGSSFPYEMSGKAQEYAKKYSRDLWLNDKWSKAIHPLSWLVDKFKPVPGWHDDK